MRTKSLKRKRMAKALRKLASRVANGPQRLSGSLGLPRRKKR